MHVGIRTKTEQDPYISERHSADSTKVVCE